MGEPGAQLHGALPLQAPLLIWFWGTLEFSRHER